MLDSAINLDALSRVEVIIGPSSVLYGAYALSATVNLITEQKDGVEAIVSAKSPAGNSGTVQIGKTWSPTRSASTIITVEKHDGFDWVKNDTSLHQPAVGMGYRNAGKLNEGLFSVTQAKYDDWSAQLTLFQMEKPEMDWVLAAYMGDLPNDPQNGDNGVRADKLYSGQVQHAHAWTNQLQSVIIGEYAVKQVHRLIYGPVHGFEWEQKTTSTEAGLKYTLEKTFIQTGVQIGSNDNGDNLLLNQGQPLDFISDKTTTSVGGYFSVDQKISSALSVVGAVRADHNDELNNKTWYPGSRLALVYAPSDTLISKLLYNSSIRMPSPVASPLNTAWTAGQIRPEFWGMEIANNPADEPERLSTIEWQNIKYFDKYRLSVNIYHQKLENFITWFNPFTNVGDFTGDGVEGSVYGELNDDFAIRGSLTYNRNRFSAKKFPDQYNIPPIPEDEDLLGIPVITATAGFEWRFMEKGYFDLAGNYFTRQKTTVFTAADPRRLNNRYYLDATFSWLNLLNNRLEARLAIKNVLDNRDPVHMGMVVDSRSLPQGTSGEIRLYYRF